MTHTSLAFFIGLIVLQLTSMLRAQTTQPATPDFGPNVLVFDPTSPDMQKQIDAIYATQEAGQFNDKRYAILFKPGKYDLDVKVGFYTHVLGLGTSPDDVQITGAVRSKAKWMKNNNATCNFWRAVENLSITPSVEGNVNVWAVSQGTAMRRVHIRGDLHLSDGGWSSGGFLADSVIDGTVDSGSQQQWLSRNCEYGKWVGGNWNMVFVGVKNAPKGDWPEKPYTTVETADLPREKPFLAVDDAGQFAIRRLAHAAVGERQGASWKTTAPKYERRSLDRCFIARADRDTAATMNAALAEGKDLLLTPGIYHLDAPLRVTHANTVVLGIGYPTLVATRGTPAMIVTNDPETAVGGILLEAGEIESPTLLQVVNPQLPTDAVLSPSDDQLSLFDIFCRAGGASVGRTGSFIEINSGNVVGDNLWLWRADHGVGAKWDENKNETGLIVNGDNVTMYGLFVEHTQGYQTLWNGNGGRVYLYQSEMPYDPPSQDAWQHDGVRGYASYKVSDKVTTHEAWGLGVYCVFHSAPVIADSAIESPNAPGVKFHNMLTKRLTGKPGSGIAHVINDRGDPAMGNETVRLKE